MLISEPPAGEHCLALESCSIPRPRSCHGRLAGSPVALMGCRASSTDPLGCRRVSLGSNRFHQHRAEGRVDICWRRLGAEHHHDVHVMDADRTKLASRRLPEGLAGIREFHELVACYVEEPSRW